MAVGMKWDQGGIAVGSPSNARPKAGGDEVGAVGIHPKVAAETGPGAKWE